ncbi:DUF5805 domain-containing protein [Halorubellus salinus]|uniref:DUF5805 domain-containing protein n=1 Tax=Halorubellus salinus TaxID=755309 RepID=UPI001D091F03
MSEPDVERAVVKTYVPAYQKDAWVEHADRLDMSQSEFVRTMVQAGRRDFTVDGSPAAADHPSTPGPDRTGSGNDAEDDASDARSEFEDRVYALLQEETRSWDDLLEAVTDDVEGRLEDALQSLQAANKVVYSGRNGGYEAIGE